MKRKETIKNSNKKRFQYGFFKKHRALTVSLIIILVGIGSFFVINYGRYVKNIIEVYYLRTKNFYFSSDKLTINGKTYEVNPWGGTEAKKIDINMSGQLNSLKSTSSDITYEISCAVEGTNASNTVCYFDNDLTKQSMKRTIGTDDHKDNFVLFVALKDATKVKNGDVITVSITAVSISPYKETLTAKFNLVIGNYGVNYYIEDEANRLYMDAIVTNTYDTDSIKAKLTFVTKDNDKTSPFSIGDFSIDMTNSIFNATGTTYETDTNGNITSITFVVGPKSSMMVRYFKKDSTKNNSYDSIGTPAVKFECTEGCE